MPDAFIGPMASLITAINTGGTPLTSVADNLNTIRVVTAAYESMAQGRTVPLAQIPG
jgi:predicted dehydrogenase